MDLVPKTNQSEDQQYKSHQEQTVGPGSIHGMPVMPLRVFRFSPGGEHGSIVAPVIALSTAKDRSIYRPS